MKVLLIYFSQTGNTKKITDQVSQGIESTGVHCDVVPMKGYDISKLPEYDLVGLGFPVFFYHEPFNVRDFIQDLPPLNHQHWFIYVTHANAIGEALPITSESLTKKGAIVVGYHDTYADATVPFYPKPLYIDGHPDEAELEEAKRFGEHIVEFSPKVSGPESELIPEPLPVSSEYWKQESERLSFEYLEKAFPKLSINLERCTKCSTCMERCPVDGIDVHSDPPRIQEPCSFCWHCVNVCPVLAIEADWSGWIAGAPATFKEYRKELEIEATKGNFRWLIDPDSINFNDPLIRQRERKLGIKRK
jgi:flavodoxin/ferredoxin